MYKIAIVGVGQLGSRYLQGLAVSDIEISLEIVEPFDRSIKLAQSRLKEIENKAIMNIKWLKDIKDLSDKIDLVIVTTTADVRSNIVKYLLKNKIVNNLLLEKVLFQKEDDFYDIEKLLKEKNVKCWVNHPRRIYPFYQKLKEKLKNKKIFLDFKGSNWGLACNGMHFIDLLSYLTDSYELNIETKYLEKRIYNSKREKFKEINGMLIGTLDQHIFSLYSTIYNISNCLKIIADDLIYEINESTGEYKIWDGEKWQTKNERIIFYQSEITPSLVKDIFEENCKLPTYTESMKLHIPFIKELTKHFKTFGSFNYCPIT
ncbi:Gfo/Idh/MocA family oxidoreductase [Caminibacter mediatlanticus]|uniref:Predicted dehydrogenase n=1 Tax=Caminibacter mediatlanticus TB-2 TaxID=391592 RepID=A0AAI9AGN5_9BACT|nr:Gfo/Idh/MocA family oxidoreductase [Caminibacter mediatlanticus]EDM23160.1 Predicted dehydrogenase [Caminibacter mediatlanticus TB-2]